MFSSKRIYYNHTSSRIALTFCVRDNREFRCVMYYEHPHATDVGTRAIGSFYLGRMPSAPLFFTTVCAGASNLLYPRHLLLLTWQPEWKGNRCALPYQGFRSEACVLACGGTDLACLTGLGASVSTKPAAKFSQAKGHYWEFLSTTACCCPFCKSIRAGCREDLQIHGVMFHGRRVDLEEFRKPYTGRFEGISSNIICIHQYLRLLTNVIGKGLCDFISIFII